MFKLILKPGKDKPILNRHPWIFSGAVKHLPQCENGSLVQVFDDQNHLLGSAYYNRKSSIVARMVAWGSQDPVTSIKTSIQNAKALRKSLISANTNTYRLINAEGDFLPGLIVDRYDTSLVLQISTLGMEKLKPIILEELKQDFMTIYEKSVAPSRKEEGLNAYEGILCGTLPKEIEILEKGHKFIANPQSGQKTGFFLDQVEMRAWVKILAQQRHVLNCFAYTGGFTVYALAGGALSVDSVDISSDALHLAERNCLLNGFKNSSNRFFAEDVFQFLRSKALNYELVILDPPAFAKSSKDVINACRGYKDINRLALQKMPKGSILITCSCSHFVDEKLFQQVVFQAACEAKRQVRIIGKHRQASDHPINLFHPEGSYLKSLVLFVE